jgi:hypothetical protein
MLRKLSVPFVVPSSGAALSRYPHIKAPTFDAHHLNTMLLAAHAAAGVANRPAATNTSLLGAFSAGGVKTALSKGAVGPTGIAALIIAVVTEFARGNEPIAATRYRAERRAIIVVVLVGIITGFTGAYHAIAASRLLTIR